MTIKTYIMKESKTTPAQVAKQLSAISKELNKLADRYEMLRTKYLSAEGRAAYYKKLYEDLRASTLANV